jgi:hypothetical protein
MEPASEKLSLLQEDMRLIEEAAMSERPGLTADCGGDVLLWMFGCGCNVFDADV